MEKSCCCGRDVVFLAAGIATVFCSFWFCNPPLFFSASTVLLFDVARFSFVLEPVILAPDWSRIANVSFIRMLLLVLRVALFLMFLITCSMSRVGDVFEFVNNLTFAEPSTVVVVVVAFVDFVLLVTMVTDGLFLWRMLALEDAESAFLVRWLTSSSAFRLSSVSGLDSFKKSLSMCLTSETSFSFALRLSSLRFDVSVVGERVKKGSEIFYKDLLLICQKNFFYFKNYVADVSFNLCLDILIGSENKIDEGKR